MTEVTIPAGVTSIEENAFYGCSSLTSVNIPDSVTSIGSSAFSGCGFKKKQHLQRKLAEEVKVLDNLKYSLFGDGARRRKEAANRIEQIEAELMKFK